MSNDSCIRIVRMQEAGVETLSETPTTPTRGCAPRSPITHTVVTLSSWRLGSGPTGYVTL